MTRRLYWNLRSAYFYLLSSRVYYVPTVLLGDNTLAGNEQKQLRVSRMKRIAMEKMALILTHVPHASSEIGILDLGIHV
jgi:hypothetical protein